MEKYRLIKNLGDGTYGTVMEAINSETGEKVAIKQMKQEFKTWDECVNLREIKSLRKLNHPNIVKLKEVLKINSELYLVFEHMDINIYQLYLSFKERKEKMPERMIRQIIFQTTQGLAYMHKHGYFHRDLKPENILISSDRHTVKICDFGLAREIRSRPPFTDYVSTRWYRGPELLLKTTIYNSPVDIFALGCIMIELYLLNPLWSGSNEIDHLFQIVNTLGTPSQTTWPDANKLASKIGFLFPQNINKTSFSQIMPDASPEAIQLIDQMLQYDPTKRPTAMQILQHPYFTGQALNNLGNDSEETNSYGQKHDIILNSEDPTELKPPAQAPFKSYNNNSYNTDGLIVPLTNTNYNNTNFKSGAINQQNKVQNASQFVKHETERINKERNNQLSSQQNDYHPIEDPFWNYQIPGTLSNTKPVLKKNDSFNQQNDAFKQGGLGVNSIKHPGPPAFSLINKPLSPPYDKYHLSSLKDNHNSSTHNLNSFNLGTGNLYKNHNSINNVGSIQNNILGGIHNNGGIYNQNTHANNPMNNYNQGNSFNAAVPLVLSSNTKMAQRLNAYQSYQPQFNQGMISKPNRGSQVI